MAITIPATATNNPLSSANALASGSTPKSGLFSNVLENFLSDAAQSNSQAQSAIIDLASGKNDNFHEVVLQVAKNDLQFRLMLQIRNRLTDAYQEIMKMQVG